MAYDSIDRDDDERIVMGGRRGAQESVRGATVSHGGMLPEYWPALIRLQEVAAVKYRRNVQERSAGLARLCGG